MKEFIVYLLQHMTPFEKFIFSIWITIMLLTSLCHAIKGISSVIQMWQIWLFFKKIRKPPYRINKYRYYRKRR
jgi:hypothetical protein